MEISAEEEKRYTELQGIALNAARAGDDGLLAPMIRAGIPLELRDGKGNTLLMLAAYHGNRETVELLLAAGAEPDARNDRGQTPLGGVAFKGHAAIAHSLLAAGADPLADQGGGKTPAMFAAMFGREEVLTLLEQAAGAPDGRLLGVRLTSWAKIARFLRRTFFSPPLHASIPPV